MEWMEAIGDLARRRRFSCSMLHIAYATCGEKEECLLIEIKYPAEWDTRVLDKVLVQVHCPNLSLIQCKIWNVQIAKIPTQFLGRAIIIRLIICR